MNFPILIRFEEKGSPTVIVENAEDLPVGRAFTVMETDYSPDKGTAKELAAVIHEEFCHSSHVDQCGWDYDKDWSSTKKSYLEKANKILKVTDLVTAIKVVKICGYNW